VLQDGSSNHIWVVGPTHTAATPAVKLFATTPTGSEPTGITFSPDYRYLFMSFQHPSTANTATQTDAAGSTVVFNTHTTIVIARREFLGACNSPSALAAASITSNSATVSWAAQPGALSYDLDFKPATSGTWSNAATATTALSVNLSGLSASTAYNWRVRTNCGAGSSSYSESTFTTAAPACPGPYDVAGNDALAGAATISLNENVLGTIWPTADKDYYKFTKVNAGTITVTLSTLPANYNLELRSAANVLLASSSKNGTASESTTYSAAAGTSYYAVAVPKGNVKNQTVCYTLRVAASSARLLLPDPELTSDEGMPGLQAWPVPVSETLFLELPEWHGPATVQVFGLSGQLLLERTIQSQVGQVDVSSLKPGLYLLWVKDGTQSHQLKFAKSN
jgi:Fibronectin type III domain/Bacterial protein of unknown function (DUF839)